MISLLPPFINSSKALVPQLSILVYYLGVGVYLYDVIRDERQEFEAPTGPSRQCSFDESYRWYFDDGRRCVVVCELTLIDENG